MDLFLNFPQPIFLLNKDFQLLKSNQEAEQVISKKWIEVRSGKIYFDCIDSKKKILKKIDQLTKEDASQLSIRFVLRSPDMICRVYTISLVPGLDELLLLAIYSDQVSSSEKVMCLSDFFSLTSRETEIIKMMVLGSKPKEIAFNMGVSLNTVRSHLRTLYAKMQVRNYSQALAYAMRLLA